MDEFYRAMVLGYLLPLALILLLLLVFSRRNNTVFLAVTLVLFLGVMLLVSPYTYDVNSKQNCYAYNEGVQEYLDIHLVTIRGIYVQRIFDTSHFSGEWKISGFTDGFEPITIYSPDDRPYKNVTRYDENGEKLRQASFQFFGNSRFTDYVLLVGQVVGWEADWDPANGSILCSNAETYNEMTACAARHNIGYLDPIETEVVP